MNYLKLIFITLLVTFSSCSSKYSNENFPIETNKKNKESYRRIIIDAGHGGRDPGAISWDRRHQEKNLNLATAMMVRDHLKQMGYKPALTRSKNIFIPLNERAEMANKRKAELFVSIHYNSAHNNKARGIEVYYYPHSNNSKQLAITTLENVLQQTKALSRGIKTANFTVLTQTKMPAILVEGGFMSSSKEMNLLQDPEYLNRLAYGIAIGIDQHLKSH